MVFMLVVSTKLTVTLYQEMTRVAVIGCGSIGTKYVRWLLPTAFEIGAFDLDVNKVEQLKAKNLKIFATLSDLISWKPTHVLVATPPISHRVVVETILANCYEAKILIEKPLATNLEDGRKLLEASKTFPGQLYGVCN